jgi:O-antigen/teichoic acid export membrane protein
MFGVLGALRRPVVELLVGHTSSTGEAILLTFCGVWLLHVPARGVWLAIVAAGKQPRLTPVLAMELALNLALSIAFGQWFGAIGVARATFVAVLVTYAVVLPFVFRGIVRGVGRVIWKDGIVVAAAAAALSFGLVTVLTRAAHGVVVPVLAGAGVGAVMLVAAALGLGSDTRRTLRTAAGSPSPVTDSP